jgi:hypothetical protein
MTYKQSAGCLGFTDGPGTMTFTRSGGRESVVLQPNGTAELRTAVQP